MSAFKTIKQADHRIKTIVFGYMRDHELLELITIPPLITYQCLAYYFLNEYISTTDNNNLKISTNRLTVTNIGKHALNGYVHLNQYIPSLSKLIAKWTFYIHVNYTSFNGHIKGKRYSGFNTVLCLASKTDIKHGVFYHIQGCRILISHNDKKYKFNRNVFFGSGDTVTVILNLMDDNNGILSIKINENKEIVLFHNVTKSENVKYKMCIQLMDSKSAISLKKYQEIYE
eukprot:305582_1